jgi:hypothetical protein
MKYLSSGKYDLSNSRNTLEIMLEEPGNSTSLD